MFLTLSFYAVLACFVWAPAASAMMEPGEEEHPKKEAALLSGGAAEIKNQTGKKVILKGMLSNHEDVLIAVPQSYAGQSSASANVSLSSSAKAAKEMNASLQNAALYERVINNMQGLHVNIKAESLGDPFALVPLFDALVRTLSVKTLKCEGIYLDVPKALVLASALTRNTSLRRLDLGAATLSLDALTIIGYSLQTQKSLRELILPSQLIITDPQTEAFYTLIKDNTGLRLISWPKDDKVLKKVRSLSEGKNRAAILHRSLMFAEGIFEKQDITQAVTCLQKAHTLGHPLASYEIGRLKEKQGSAAEALTWYTQAANQGHPSALTKLGDYYRGIWPKSGLAASTLPSTPNYQEKPAYNEAYNHYNQAARLGHSKALYRIGRMYEAGRFVEKDFSKAASYFYEALQRGCAEGAIGLGGLYNNPEYKDHDHQSAKYYFEWAKRFEKTKGTAERLSKGTAVQSGKKA